MTNDIRRRANALFDELHRALRRAVDLEEEIAGRREEIAALQGGCQHADRRGGADPLSGHYVWTCRDCRKSWIGEQP